MRFYELGVCYDARKSFYGKAHVVEHSNGKVQLQSYDTIVAEISKSGVPKVFGTYSNTTLRHIKEFLLQWDFKAESKKQIESDYMGGK